MSAPASVRKNGDHISIPGNYQYEATWNGAKTQRFWHQSRFLASARLLDARQGESVLDVGCGSGVFADLLSKSGANIVAVDANRSAIEFASQKFQKPNLQFRLGLVDEIQFGKNSFDKASFLEVIEHISVEQATETLRRLHGVLRDKGRLVISTPNRLSLWPLIEWSMDRLRLAPTMAEEQHIKIYDQGSLREVADAAGFRCVEMVSVNAVAPFVAPLNWKLAEGIRSLETKSHIPFGGLLIGAFEKR